MTTTFANDAPIRTHNERPLIARVIHRLAVPIILGWLGIIVLLTLAVPSLEQIGQEHSVALSPKDAPSIEAMTRIANDFKEGNSDSPAMLILEGTQPLDDNAHKYYDVLIRKLRADPHVLSVQDFWGDPLTASGAQSADGKAAYVQVILAGNQGEPLATRIHRSHAQARRQRARAARGHHVGSPAHRRWLRTCTTPATAR